MLSHIPDWVYLLTQYHIIWKSWETAIVLTLTVDQYAILIRTPSPSMPERGIVYWYFQWDISSGWVSYFSPLENYSISSEIPFAGHKLDFLKHSILVMEHIVLKEERMWMLWSGILSSLVNMYNIYNQLKFLKLPTFLSSWEVEHILLSISMFMCPLQCFERLYSTHRSTYCLSFKAFWENWRR